MLLASGLVAGEALTGILLAAFVSIKEDFLNKLIGNLTPDREAIVANGIVGIILYFGVLAFLAYMMIQIPLKKIRENNNS